MANEKKPLTEADYKAMTPAQLREHFPQLGKGATNGKVLKAKFDFGHKGNIKITGLGQRFPHSFYAAQLLALFDAAEEGRAFIEANRSKLSFKGEMDEA